jgi:hypothetical protein
MEKSELRISEVTCLAEIRNSNIGRMKKFIYLDFQARTI